MAYTNINKSTDYFNTKLYTGNGSTNAITGIGFQPDWIWSKNRDSSTNHYLVDVIRGTEYELRSNNTNHSAGDGNLMDSFDSDGFTLSSSGSMNTSSANYVSWNWKAGGSGSANTDGSISSTVSANTTSGFSIVKWTGSGANATIGHGLGVAPKLIITKSLASGSNQEWCVGSDAIGWGNYMFLNETSAVQSGSTYWQSTAPTSSVFSVGTAGPTNTSSGDLIAYCFVEKTGFSKFGTYQGNSNANGAFIYTGFKPAIVITKQATGGNANEVWGIRDNKRDIDNPITKSLIANATSAEGTTSTHYVDFLSNGFKIRTGTENALNTGYGYLYIAFAEAPLVGSNNIPCTAR